MNQTTKILEKVKLWQTFTTCSVASILTFGAVVAPAQAATFMADVIRPGFPNSSYNGNWMFDVMLDTNTNKIKFTVTGSNSPSGDDFNGYMYMYSVTESNGKYSFNGSDPGVPSSSFPLKMKGMYTPGTNTLMIDNPIMSGSINFEVSNIKPVPEPTTIFSLLTLGSLGTASTLKRKLKLSKSAAKETTKAI